MTIQTPVGGPSPRPGRSWVRGAVVVAALGLLGLAGAYTSVRDDDIGGETAAPAPVPDDPCGLLPDEVVDALVPEAETEDTSSNEGSGSSSARCTLATDQDAMDIMATAELEIEVERFSADGSRTPEDAYALWRNRADEDDELRDLDGLGSVAFVREYGHSDWFRNAEVAVVDGDLALRLRYAASPADQEPVSDAAQRLTEEVMAAL